MSKIVHEGLSRGECEERLLLNAKDGSYLVRESETFTDTFSLSILYKDVVKHYRIKKHQNQYYVDAEQGVERTYKPTIFELIEEYRGRGDKNGLVHALLHPVLPCAPVDSDGEIPEDEMEDEHYDYVPPQEQSTNTLKYVAEELQRKLLSIDLSAYDGEFVTSLNEYTTKSCLHDAMLVNGGTEQPTKLHEVLTKAASNLIRELDVFKQKVDCIQQLFGYRPTELDNALPTRKGSRCEETYELDKLREKLKTSALHLQKAESNAVSSLQQILNRTPSAASPTTIPHSQPDVPKPSILPRGRIPPQQFVAQLYKHYCKSSGQVHILVDVHAGKVSAVRPHQHNLDESNVFVSDKITQLVKSTKVNSVVTMYLDGRSKPEVYQFEDMRQRELFCQLVGHMKMIHTRVADIDQLSVFIGTWNMADETPAWKLDDWFRCQGEGLSRPELLSDVPFDMYVIGTQETNISEKECIKRVQDYFASRFPDAKWKLVTSEALWQIRICIFIKFEYRNMITSVETSKQATGIANTLYNKGAVAVSFSVRGTSLCFICAHLTSGSEKNNRRNQNYKDILKGLKLGPKNLSNECDLTNKFHHMFFFGDLNYRIDGLQPEDIISKVEKRDYHVLLNYDQLNGTKQNGEAFWDFKEAPINFAPTYRYAKNSSTNHYVWQKVKRTGVRINAPSYTDRVLWKSYPDTFIESLAYGCLPKVNVSDHKPVFAAFKIGLVSPFLSPRAKPGMPGNTKVIFKELSAHVKVNTKMRMTIEVVSACLEMPKRLPTNVDFSSYREGYCSPTWTAKSPVKIDMAFEDLEFLEDQHLVMIVKSNDLMDHYGSTVISLRHAVSGPSSFEVPLIYEGAHAGSLRGVCQIETKSHVPTMSPRRRKSYNFIYFDTDNLGDVRPAATLLEVPEDVQYCDVSGEAQYSEDMENNEYAEVVAAAGQTVNTATMNRPAAKPPTTTMYTEITQKPSFKKLVEEGVRSPVTKPPAPSSRDAAVVDTAVYSESSGVQDDVYEALYESRSPVENPRRPNANRQSPPSERAVVRSPRARENDNTYSNSDLEPTHMPLSQILGAEKKQSASRAKELPPSAIRHPTDDVDEAEEDEGQCYYNVAPNVETFEDNPLYECDSDVGSPPTLPPRMYQAQPDQYVRVFHPATVKDWLKSLGLGHHLQKFTTNGWDSMAYIGDLTSEDLRNIGLDSSSDRDRILQSLVTMQKKTCLE